MTQEALKLALEALKTIDEAMPFPVAKLAQAAIKEALAKSEQEPVAHMNQHGVIHEAGYPWGPTNRLEPLYTTPPQRTWVGLTEEEFQWIYDNGRTPAGMMEIVEAKLKELNT